MRFVPNHKIDKHKWDNAITNLLPQFIYLQSFYLDIVTQNQWGAYINDDYSCLFPVHFDYRLGIKRLHQPSFSQQLGLFCGSHIAINEIDRFFGEITNPLKKINWQINSLWAPESIENCKRIERVTYTLNLNRSYETIEKDFSSNTRRNIKKAEQINQDVTEIDIEEFVQLIHSEKQRSGLRLKHILILEALIRELDRRNLLVLNGVRFQNSTIAAAIWINTPARVYYLHGVSTSLGMQNRSMFLLQKQLINRLSNQNSLLDFEGSMIPGIAKFFSGFGAMPETYYVLQKNTLPKLIARFF